MQASIADRWHFAPRWSAILLAVIAVTVLVVSSGSALTLTSRASGSEAIVSRMASVPAPAFSDRNVRSVAPTAHAPSDPAAPTWINVTSSVAGATPPGMWGGASAYDPVDNVTVYFGGCSVNVCPTTWTWVFSRGAWTNITNVYDAPPARDSEAMDWDPNMQAVLMFSGVNLTGAYYDDTWIFVGGIWTNVTWVSASDPIGREDASLAFDPDPEVNGSVLFGGQYSGGFLNTTWVWEAWSGWVKFTQSDLYPPELADAAMAFDPASDYLVLYGGYGPAGYNTETWEFISGNWFETYPGEDPGSTYDNLMVYDPSLSGDLLFSYYNEALATFTNQTWLFSNGQWSELTLATAPPGSYTYAFSLDPSGLVPLLTGGYNYTIGTLNATWVFEVPPTVSETASQTTRETGQSITFTATIAGGTGPYNATFNFGDGKSAQARGNGPELTVNHSYAEAGVYHPTVTIYDSVGAEASNGTSGLTVQSGLSLEALAAPASGDVGFPVHFSATTPAPGVPPVTYAWTFGDSTTGTGVNVSHTYTVPGTFRVNVTATDSIGGTANASVTVTIAPDLKVTLTSNPVKPFSGRAGTFYANATNGTGPYQYSWTFGDGNTSSFPAPEHTYAHTGVYEVQVWVNDSAGDSVHQELQVTVVAPPTTSAGIPLWFVIALVVIIAAGVAGAVLLLRRNRAPPA